MSERLIAAAAEARRALATARATASAARQALFEHAVPDETASAAERTAWEDKARELRADAAKSEKAERIAESEAEDAAQRAEDSTPVGYFPGAGNHLPGEQRESQRIAARAKLGAYLVAGGEKRSLEGAEAELNAAAGCAPDASVVPLSLFGPPGDPIAERLQSRAITGVPADDTVSMVRRIVPAVFRQSIAARLGISMPMVNYGQSNTPILTTPPPADTVAKDANAPNTAAVFTLAERTPKRITGQFEVRVEDLAILPQMEGELRQSLRRAISNELDAQVIAGSGAGSNMSGLFHVATDVAADGALATFATALAKYTSKVDGFYAYGPMDLYAAIGSDTYALFSTLFNATNGDVSLFDYLQMRLGELVVSNRVPATAAMAQKGLIVLNGPGVGAIEIPCWTAMRIITDDLTGARQGKRVITSYALCGDPVVPFTTDRVFEVHPKIAA